LDGIHAAVLLTVLTPRLPPARGAEPAGNRHTPLFRCPMPRISAAGPSPSNIASAVAGATGGRPVSPH